MGVWVQAGLTGPGRGLGGGLGPDPDQGSGSGLGPGRGPGGGQGPGPGPGRGQGLGPGPGPGPGPDLGPGRGAEGQGGSPGPGPGGSVNLAAAGLKSGWNPRGTAAVGGDPGGGAWAREGQAPPPRPPSPRQAPPSPAHSAHLPEVAQSALLPFPRVAGARGRRSLVPLSRGHTGPGPPGGPVERSRLTSAGTGGAAETAEARGGGPGSLAPSGGRSRRGATARRCARLRALGTALGPAGRWRGRGGVVIRREAGEGPASVHPEAQHHQVPASLLYTARVGF